MIWESPLLMELVDAAIVLAALAVIAVFYRHRRAIRLLRLYGHVAWIVSGLSVMALFHAGNLMTMLVLTALTSPETALAVMSDLHFQWSWLASLITVACIAFGMFGLLGRLLPQTSESITFLQAELDARKRAEDALRESEQRFHDFSDASSDWFWEMDENLRFSYFSDSYRRITGSLQDHLLGTTREETDVPGVDPEVWQAHLADIAAHRPFREFELTRSRADGSPVYLSINGKPIFDEEGNFLGYRGVGADITERKRAERRLSESEGRLQSFIKNSPGAVSIKDIEGRYLLINPVFEKIFGVTCDAAIGKRLQDIASPAFVASSEAHDRAVLETGQVVEREEALEFGQKLLELFTVKFPLRDDAGEMTAIGTIRIDITERKRAEEALQKGRNELEERVEARTAELRESERSLANAQRIARMGSWDRNIVTNELHWSEETCRIFGLDPQEFGGTYEAFLDTVHPDDRALVADAASEMIASHESYNIEYRLLRPDGVMRIVHARGEVTYGDDGTPLRVSGTVQDISERKRADEALRESQVWLSKAQSRAKLGFWDWVFDDKGTEHWSDNASEILGVPIDDFFGGYEKYLELVHPEDREYVHDAYRLRYPDHDDDSSGYDIDYRIVRPDGSVIWINEIAEQERDDSGKPIRNVGTIQDITERKQAEEEIRRLNEHLEGLVEERTIELRNAQADLVRKERLAALGQLTATVSHELRNPLGAIRSSVAVMKRIIDDKNPLLVESADIADRSINRCDAIISDLLDFTRIRPLKMTRLSIDQWLDVMLDEYRLPEGITLRRDLASAVDVQFDSESLRRSFLNLLDNACQAMIGDANSAEQAAAAPAGGHVLTVASRISHDRLEVMVGDTGPGIPDANRDTIFEPLYSTKNFGVGLGLSIVMQIAKQHGGGVEYSESKAVGAVFTLWLPIDTDAIRRVS